MAETQTPEEIIDVHGVKRRYRNGSWIIVRRNVPWSRLEPALHQSLFGSSGYPGFCVACGADADDCEPDARGYRCEHCSCKAVYGADEINMMGWVDLSR